MPNETFTYGALSLAIHGEPYRDLDRYVLREVQQEYFWNAIDMRRVKTVLDVGANIGAYTRYALSLNSSIAVRAIEPELTNYMLLYQNTKDYASVKRHHAWLGYDTRLNTLVVDPTNSGAHRIIAADDNDSLPTRMTIENIMSLSQWSTIDLMKIDCEGCECDVLMNAPDHVFDSIGCIVGERHLSDLAFFNGIGQRLLDLGYDVLDRPHRTNAERGVFLARKAQV